MRALVWTHRLAKRYDAAAGLQESLAALELDSVEALEALSLIRQDQGRSDEAIEGLREVIARDSSRPAAHLVLGFALEALGRADEAIENYKAGVQLKPDMAYGWHLLSNAYQGQNRLADAVPATRRPSHSTPIRRAATTISASHTGAGAIADSPGDADYWHSEKLIRPANGFLCYRPPADAPAVAPPPSAESSVVTFGSFNTLAKLSSELLDAWALLLARLPEARLVIKTVALDDPAVHKDLLEALGRRGITAGHVALRGFEEQLADHLDRYREIDIALDSTPYTGTTTTCEALWMGVPVVTLAGARHVGRVGASLLGQLRMDELTANSQEGYVEIAAALAGDPARLAAMRDGMRERMRTSPLTDETGFAASFETALREMWRAWCKTSP